jgi:hypothetical protein
MPAHPTIIARTTHRSVGHRRHPTTLDRRDHSESAFPIEPPPGGTHRDSGLFRSHSDGSRPRSRGLTGSSPRCQLQPFAHVRRRWTSDPRLGPGPGGQKGTTRSLRDQLTAGYRLLGEVHSRTQPSASQPREPAPAEQRDPSRATRANLRGIGSTAGSWAHGRAGLRALGRARRRCSGRRSVGRRQSCRRSGSANIDSPHPARRPRLCVRDHAASDRPIRPANSRSRSQVSSRATDPREVAPRPLASGESSRCGQIARGVAGVDGVAGLEQQQRRF